MGGGSSVSIQHLRLCIWFVWGKPHLSLKPSVWLWVKPICFLLVFNHQNLIVLYMHMLCHVDTQKSCGSGISFIDRDDTVCWCSDCLSSDSDPASTVIITNVNNKSQLHPQTHAWNRMVSDCGPAAAAVVQTSVYVTNKYETGLALHLRFSWSPLKVTWT